MPAMKAEARRKLQEDSAQSDETYCASEYPSGPQRPHVHLLHAVELSKYVVGVALRTLPTAARSRDGLTMGTPDLLCLRVILDDFKPT